jgi:hypothetical protein
MLIPLVVVVVEFHPVQDRSSSSSSIICSNVNSLGSSKRTQKPGLIFFLFICIRTGSVDLKKKWIIVQNETIRHSSSNDDKKEEEEEEEEVLVFPGVKSTFILVLVV